ncbi:TM vesicle-mediated sorter chorein, partial [Helicosporidium sp. ATCC 50920]
MFEAQVGYYLNKYLGTYLEGIDPNSLKISIYSGDVVLENLHLKADALAELDLPVTVKAGVLGSLRLTVPWNALGTQPVEVYMDRLYLVATPRAEGKRTSAVETAEDVRRACREDQRLRVARFEKAWAEDLERQDRAGGAESEEGGSQGGGRGWLGTLGGGLLKSAIDTVIGNLQLHVTNVHVRYEDATSHPGHPFATGVTLASLVAATADEQGNESFVTASPLSLLRKTLRLRRAAVYFDSEAACWDPGRAWSSMNLEDWDAWFLVAELSQ